jgi:hypothetical protein
MHSDYETYLYESYPTLYELHAADTDTDDAPPLARHGIQCDDGWFPLLDTVSDLLERAVLPFAHPQTPDTPEAPVSPLQFRAVREDGGHLVLQTTPRDEQPHPVEVAYIWFAQTLSKSICERCGATTGAQRDGRTHTTRCDACHAATELPPETPVWKFDYDCHECATTVPVVFPQALGASNGGTWAPAGDELISIAAANGCRVEHVMSYQQGARVFGNVCSACDAYLGNFYVAQHAHELATQYGWQHTPDAFELVAYVGLDNHDPHTPARTQ